VLLSGEDASDGSLRPRYIGYGMGTISSAARLLDACLGKPVDRPPVWMMRQAGRYLPEYRKVRERLTFLELCRNPDAAAEVSLQPLRRFSPDGVIFFSDILIPVEAMGVAVSFGDGGPDLPEPVRSSAAVGKLTRFDPAERLAFTGEILRRLRRETGDAAAVLGFCGAPWTLASYMVEGGGSRSFAVIKEMALRNPETLRLLLDLTADVVAEVLSYQIASGAQVVQLFDTWAGELSPEDYRTWALPAARRAISGIRRQGAPVILYVNGCGGILEDMASSGADVLSVDWRITLAEARRRAPGKVLQGNLDPAVLNGTPEETSRRTRSLLAETGGRRHVVNLGHGILPSARLECVEAFFEAARTPVAAAAEALS
jgi:uroporphyrinogen decarboxylase